MTIENLVEMLQKTDVDVFEKQVGARLAVMYAVAYLYEHREEADHKTLTLGLRALLFGVRETGF